MIQYKALNKQEYHQGSYKIVPIRFQDRYKIMQWRNEQIYHLRQNKILTIEDQDLYFNTIINNLFDQEKPYQILFSYLDNGICIGYGGLVHINWIDQHAEVSFIMDTELETNEFEKHWSIYLSLIEQVAFASLSLHKVFTYAYNLRPLLFKVLESNNFNCEAILKDHIFSESKYIDVLIHAKISHDFIFLKASHNDLDITYKWASDPIVRKYSLSSHSIDFEEHKKWFYNKLNDKNCWYYIVLYQNKIIGSLRFDLNQEGSAIISYLLDRDFHGKGLGFTMLQAGIKKMRLEENFISFSGTVLNENIASIKIFKKLGFEIKNFDKEKFIFEKEY
jgi:ribosomal protein S18 acetylase RimI-like enzyme